MFQKKDEGEFTALPPRLPPPPAALFHSHAGLQLQRCCGHQPEVALNRPNVDAPPSKPARQPPPLAADGRAESGPELAVHAELVPERGRTGRKAQAAPEVRFQHGAFAQALGVDCALPACIKR